MNVAVRSFALVAASLFAASGARADSKECVEAAERGQQLRNERRLIEAREQFVSCSRPECPALVTRDCTAWAERSNTEIPKLVPRAKSEDGQDLLNVRLFIDGKLYADKLDGRRIVMDPGAHLIRFDAPGRELHEENVVLAEADVRALTVTLRPLKPPPPAPAITSPAPRTSERRGPPAATYVLGALSLVGFAGFGYFGLTGSHDESGLEDGCSKTKSCSQRAVDDVRTKYLIADISLGVGVLALGGAIAFWVLRPSPSTPSTPSTTASLRLAPSSNGALMTGTF